MKAHHVPLAIALVLVGTAVALVRAQTPATDKPADRGCMMMQKAGSSAAASQNGMAGMNHGAMAGMNHQAMMQKTDGKTMDCAMMAKDQKDAKAAMDHSAMPGMNHQAMMQKADGKPMDCAMMGKEQKDSAGKMDCPMMKGAQKPAGQ